MPQRYRMLYSDNDGNNSFKDVESNSLAHAVWEVAKECGGTLVDTMILPSKENSYGVPAHVNLYPNWQKDDD